MSDSHAKTDAPPASPTGTSRMLGFVAVAGFVLMVILAECSVAYLVFPSADDIAQLTHAKLASEDLPHAEAPEAHGGDGDHDAHGGHGSSGGGHGKGGMREVKLGDFSVTSYQPASNTTLRIDLQLFGVTKAEDEETVNELRTTNEHRYREQILVILRAAEMNDLTEAGLGLIKRRILERVNRTLGKPLLQEVVVSQFSFIEQ